MGYRGWIKDSRMCSFGQKEQITKTNMYYETKNEARIAARKILVGYNIFYFVWDFLDNNGFDQFKKVFPEIYGFKDFLSRYNNSEDSLDNIFIEDLARLRNFDKFVDIHPYLSYGTIEI